MMSLKKIAVYARLPFATAAAVPVVLGAALAFRNIGYINPLDFALTLLGMVLAQLAINVWNDYHDFKQGADKINRYRNQFSGGSPVLSEDLETPTTVRRLAIALLAAAFLCGVTLAIRVDGGLGPVAVLMVAGFIGGYYYTAPPLKFCYRGFGELWIMANFGALPVLGTYYVLARELAWTPVLASFVVGPLVTNILWINQFPDYESDKAAGKRTLVVRLGTVRARYLYVLFLLMSAGCILASPAWFGMSRLVYFSLLGLMPGVAATVILFRHHDNPPEVFKGQALTIITHLSTGVLFSLGAVL